MNSSTEEEKSSPRRQKIDVPPNAFYVPSPIVLVSTMSKEGVPDISAMSAVGALCLTPAFVGIGMKPSRSTYKNIRQTGEFVVNLPLQDLLYATDFTGTRKIREVPDKIALSGLTLGQMTQVAAPFIHECPIVMGCKLVKILDRVDFQEKQVSHHLVVGKIVECKVDPEWIRDNEVRLEEMPVMIYMNRYYSQIGAVLEFQRFTDDPAKREQKRTEYRAIH